MMHTFHKDKNITHIQRFLRKRQRDKEREENFKYRLIITPTEGRQEDGENTQTVVILRLQDFVRDGAHHIIQNS